MLRSVSADIKSEIRSRDGTLRQPRQRLRKVGPFAIGSISTSEGRMRYAGSWAPSSKDDSDGEDTQAGSNASSEKPVNKQKNNRLRLDNVFVFAFVECI